MSNNEEKRQALPLQPVSLDPAANTVKLDPANNTVKVSGTTAVDGAVSLKPGQTVGVTALPNVTGTMKVTEMPNITGAVKVTELPAVTVTNFPAQAPITGAVDITKLPPVSGAVDIAKLPPVTGAVDVNKLPPVKVTEIPPVTVTNFPAPLDAVKVTSMPPVTGKVEVTNLQAVPDTVSVSQLPPVKVTEMPPVKIAGPVSLAGPLTITGMFAEKPGTLRFAVTALGGRTGFSSTTGGVSLDEMPTAVPGAEQNRDNPVPVVVALFHNPADSGVDANLDRISLGSTSGGEWTRLGWPERLEFPGKPENWINRGTGSNAPKCQLFNGANGRGFNGRRSKTSYTGDYETQDDEIRGGIIVRPGMSMCWLFELGYGSGQKATVSVVWWETPAAP